MLILAWNRVADMHGKSRFDFTGRPQSHIDEMMAEKVVLYVFKWTNDIKEARAIVYDFNQVLVQTLLHHGTLTHSSARTWLDLVGDFQIPCSLVSMMPWNSTHSSAFIKASLTSHQSRYSFIVRLKWTNEYHLLWQRTLDIQI